MRIGLALPQYSEATSAEGCIQLAPAIEALGFDSIWLGDHTVTPPTFAHAYSPGFMDAFVLMGYLAAATRTVDIGTTIVVVPYRHPLVTANMLATADNLSGGRIIFGAAAGWDAEEFAALGVPYERRGDITDEYLEAMRALWTQEIATYHGQFVDFENVVMAPKPVHEDNVRTWIGGNSPAAQRRAVRFGEVWNPSDASRQDLGEGIALMREASEAASRSTPPGVALRLDLRVQIGERPSLATPRPWSAGGTPAELANWIAEEYRDLGIQEIIFDLADPTWQQMGDSAQAIAEEMAPVLRAL
jgi:probable F420-dependent oxidoreductase